MTDFYWHIHHTFLVEPLTEPIKNRIGFIKENKAKKEIATRLRLMKPVKGKLPAKFVKAGAAYNKAGATYDKAGAAYDKAWATYVKAWAAHVKAWAAYNKVWAACKPQIEKLHAKECPDCPWDGKTIFPEEAT